MTYREFLENKIDIAPQSGIEVDPAEISPALKDHQRVCVLWALRGGRRGLFARFGLGKTVMQAICTEHAEEIAARCGEGYAVDSMQKETRAIATVYPQTAEARRDNYRNNTIEKALR